MKTYYLYQIKNNLNNKIYVGVHRTTNIDDGYMGSGKIISNAVKKYGVDNFTKTILEYFDTAEEMFAREKEVVNPEFLIREDTYNLRRGGFGGFDYINNDIEFRKRKNKKARQSTNFILEKKWGKDWISILGKLASDQAHTEKSKQKRKQTLRDRGIQSDASHMNIPEVHTKRKKTLQSINHQQGSKNSQFGTCWITDGTNNKKIKKEELDEYLNLGYTRGRKF